MADWESRPHGVYEDRPEKGIYVVREPKGIPDVILFADASDRQKLLDASMILSVQGYTARIVCVSDPGQFMKTDAAYRSEVFPDEIPFRVGLSGKITDACSFFPVSVLLPKESGKADIAREAVKLCRSNIV